MLRVARCLLLGICCLLCVAAGCSSFAVRCGVLVVCYVLIGVCCVLFEWLLVFAVCCLLVFVVCCLALIVCCLLIVDFLCVLSVVCYVCSYLLFEVL